MNRVINEISISLTIQEQIKKAEQEKGLIINFINDINRLAEAGKNGLFKMYKDIFAEAPYFEKFSIDEVKDYFTEIFKKGGIILTAYTPQKNKNDIITAFTASIPLKEKPSVAEITSPYVDVDTTCYLAEDAVIPERRRQGISRSMKGLLLSFNREAGFKTALLRTSADSSNNQLPAVKQLGAKQINNLEQEVDSLKLDGNIKSDKRVFFTFDLTK